MRAFAVAHDEQMVIAGSVRDSAICQAADLEPGDFTHPGARRCWEVMLDVSRAGDFWRGVSDLATRAARSESERDALLSYLVECEATCAAPRDVPAYADRVRAHSATRAALEVAASARAQLDQGQEGEDLISGMISALTAHRNKLARKRSRTAADLAEHLISQIERYSAGEDVESSYIPIGLDRIDEKTGGWQGGVVSVVGARTSHGKSAFLLQAACNAAQRGFAAHLLSAEDLDSDTGWRIMARATGLPARELRRYRSLSPSARSKVSASREALAMFERIRVTPISGMSPEQVVAQVRLNQAGDKTRLVLVDYLQRFPVPRHRKRYEAFTEAMDVFDRAAKEDGFAWVIASQLKRSDNDMPSLGDFRDSGAIEEVAKLVLSLHRPRKGRDDDDTIRIEVLKNSNDELGEGFFEWDGPTLRILNERPR